MESATTDTLFLNVLADANAPPIPTSNTHEDFGDPAYRSTMLQRLRRSGMLVILLWNALARLVTASESMLLEECDLEEIHQLYTNINSIVLSWRATFVKFDEMSSSCFEQAPP